MSGGLGATGHPGPGGLPTAPGSGSREVSATGGREVSAMGAREVSAEGPADRPVLPAPVVSVEAEPTWPVIRAKPPCPYRQAVQVLLEQVGAPRVLIVDADLKRLADHGFDQEVESVYHMVDVSVSILKGVLETGRPEFEGDQQARDSLSFSAQLSQVRSLICEPFYTSDHQIAGLIYVDNQCKPYAFTPYHRILVCDCRRELEARLFGSFDYQEPEPNWNPPTPLSKLRESVRWQEEERRREQARRMFCSNFVVGSALANSHPRPGELAVVFRTLHTMIEAGLSLPHALDVLGESGVSRPELLERAVAAPPRQGRTKLVCSLVALLISEGETLSQALARFPGTFAPYVTQLVRVAEASGSLPQVFEALAAQQEVARAAQLRLQSALVYPAAALLMAVVMLVVVPGYCGRGLLSFVAASGQPLGWSTALLLRLSEALDWLTRWPHGLVTLVVAGALTWGLVRQLARVDCERWLSGLLRVPALARLLRLTLASRLARSLALVLRAGVSIQTSLELAVSSAANPLLTKDLPVALDRLANGKSLAVCLAAFRAVPASFLELVSVGEESGRTPAMLDWLADLYDSELELAGERYLALAEPLVLLVLGLLVGGLILAMLWPLVSVLETL